MNTLLVSIADILRQSKLIIGLMLIVLSHSATPAVVASDNVNKLERLINFNTINMNAFEEIRFKGETNYQIVSLDTTKALRAESQASASGLLLKKTIDLSKTPYLNWTWRLEKGLQDLPETSKSGDDYAARIYLIHSGGWFFWQTKALNYVWSSRKAKETTWPNAYAPDNAMMKAVRDKSDESGVWFTEKRHVPRDFNAWLGENIAEIEGVAIMTDTDDSEGHAIVYFGDIFFTAD
tara:strand:- start:60447 stop:61154 length:708 start_codon:yes stop_codon:yes gene_type:complete